MTQPTTRVLAMLELLQAHTQLTGVELAERLGIDQRTVRRYAAKLDDLGIPVVAERGRYGGYRLLAGFKLPPLMFTDDEATAVVLGLIAGRTLGLTTSTQSLGTETALAKVQRVLPMSLRERVASVQETLGLTTTPRDARAPETAVMLGLAHAAHRRRTTRLTYDSFKGERSERDLDPYGLVVHQGRWYVSGFDHRRGEVRTFRLDRIVSLASTERSFERPEDFDAARHVTQSLSRVPYAHEVEVILRAPVAEVSRRIPPSVGSLEEVADGTRLRTRAERLDGMASMLAGLGWRFEVVRPDELRDAVRDLADALRSYV